MITGSEFRDAVIFASENIRLHTDEVNALNVFPVPDGDTGTNMSMTAAAAARELSLLEDGVTVGEAAEKTASAMLRGARGNSGVILSLIFRGISKALKNKTSAGGTDIAYAFKCAVQSAYGAVMNPSEGTVLTVIREASEQAQKKAEKGADAVEVWKSAYRQSLRTLEKTREMMPVLKNAGVVDAGGQGLVYIIQGMQSVFSGEKMPDIHLDSAPSVVNETKHDSQSDIKYCYCTELIIEKNQQNQSYDDLKEFVSSAGDCAVVVDGGDIIKVHVHTNEPGSVVQYALNFGQLSDIKIENMRLQHRNTLAISSDEVEHEIGTEKKCAFVAVSPGEGFSELFMQLGVDRVVPGGQTMNPSTEDILKAVNSVNSKNVIVLPNNKNIIMTAEQTDNLTKKKVYVLPSRTLPEGITAVLNYDESFSVDENLKNMASSLRSVKTGLVTHAVRDSRSGKRTIKKGDVLGIENGEITHVEQSAVQAAYKITRRMIKKSRGSVVTVYYGNNANGEQAQEVVSKVKSRFSHPPEITAVMGGQSVYDFIISVE